MKECPKCGGEGRRSRISTAFLKVYGYNIEEPVALRIVCQSCGWSVTGLSEKAVDDCWNKGGE